MFGHPPFVFMSGSGQPIPQTTITQHPWGHNPAMRVNCPPTVEMVAVCHGEIAMFNHEATLMMHSAIQSCCADTPSIRECMSRLWSCRAQLDENCTLLQQDTAILNARPSRHPEECDEEDIRRTEQLMLADDDADTQSAPMEEDLAQPPERSGTPLTLCK